MKTRYSCGVAALTLVACLPLSAAESTFQLDVIPLSDATMRDTSLPAMEAVSVTIAAASSVTTSSCVGGARGCPDPTPGYVSLPFPAAALPANGGAYITWMFQDLSYTGTVKMTLGLVQDGKVLWQASDSHSPPSVVAGNGYVGSFSTVVPAQALPGPAVVVFTLSYGGTISQVSQDFTVIEASPSGSITAGASAPAVQMVSVTIASSSSVTVDPCVSGDPGCPDPTPGYASIPFPAASLSPNGGAYIGTCITWMFQDLSYTGPIEITVAFVQNGVVVGDPTHNGGIGIEAGFAYLMDDGLVVPAQASPGPATVVVSLNYGGTITRASQQFTVE